MKRNKIIFMLLIFSANTVLSWPDLDTICWTTVIAAGAISAVKKYKEINSPAEAEKREEAQVRREKLKIEKALQDCFEKNIGQELSQLKVPLACAKFVKEFILMHGMDEFSKKVVDYEAIKYADE